MTAQPDTSGAIPLSGRPPVRQGADASRSSVRRSDSTRPGRPGRSTSGCSSGWSRRRSHWSARHRGSRPSCSARRWPDIPAGSFRHGWLASRLADALYRTGDRTDAEQVAQRALTYATDPDLLVDLHWTLTQCRMLSGSGAESITALEKALAAPGVTPKHRARLLVLAARTHLFLGDGEAASRDAESALAVCHAGGRFLGDRLGTACAGRLGHRPGRPDHRVAAVRSRPRRDRDRSRAVRPWFAPPDQQGSNAVQSRPMG